MAGLFEALSRMPSALDVELERGRAAGNAWDAGGKRGLIEHMRQGIREPGPLAGAFAGGIVGKASPERIVQAALRVKGEVVPTGAFHDASKIPRGLWDSHIEDGFLTSEGRFVDRKEAATIAGVMSRDMTHADLTRAILPPALFGAGYGVSEMDR